MSGPHLMTRDGVLCPDVTRPPAREGRARRTYTYTYPPAVRLGILQESAASPRRPQAEVAQQYGTSVAYVRNTLTQARQAVWALHKKDPALEVAQIAEQLGLPPDVVALALTRPLGQRRRRPSLLPPDLQGVPAPWPQELSQEDEETLQRVATERGWSPEQLAQARENVRNPAIPDGHKEELRRGLGDPLVVVRAGGRVQLRPMAGGLMTPAKVDAAARLGRARDMAQHWLQVVDDLICAHLAAGEPFTDRAAWEAYAGLLNKHRHHWVEEVLKTLDPARAGRAAQAKQREQSSGRPQGSQRPHQRPASGTGRAGAQ